MYKCFILTVLDHGLVVYHPMMNTTQRHLLEKLQMAALSIIYGRKENYSTITQWLEGKLDYLEDRRQKMVDAFIIKTAKNPKFVKTWFPRRSFTGHDLRTEVFYHEEQSKTSLPPLQFADIPLFPPPFK